MELKLNNSTIQCFKSCRRKCYFEFKLGLSPREFTEHQNFGTIIHEGIRRFFLGEDYLDFLRDKYKDWIKKAGGPADIEKIEMFYSKAKAMLEAYAAVYESDLELYDVIQIEEELQHTLRDDSDCKYILYGTPDCYAVRRSDNALVMFEHKTAGSINATYLDKLPIDIQVTNYCFLGGKNPPLRLPDEIIYNILRKTKAKRKNEESWEEFDKRMLELYLSGDNFYREPLIRDLPLLQDFEAQTLEVFDDIARIFDRHKNSWYMNTGHCGSYFGCEFLPICINGESAMNAYEQKEPKQ